MSFERASNSMEGADRDGRTVKGNSVAFSNPLGAFESNSVDSHNRSPSPGVGPTGAAALTPKAGKQLEEAGAIKTISGNKVFGTSDEQVQADLEDDAYYRSRWCGLLHPSTGASQLYDLMQTVSLFYIIIMVPWRIGFDITTTPTDPLFYVDIAVDLTLLFDLYLNFFRYTYTTTTLSLVTDPRTVRNNYLMSWFAIDLVSVFPFDFALRVVIGPEEENVARSARMVRLARLMRFARLARLMKLTNLRKLGAHLKKCTRLIGITKPGLHFFTQMLLLFLMVLGTMHVLSCVWIQQAFTNSIFGPRSAEIEEIYKDAVNPYNNWYDNNYGTDNTSTPDLTNEDQRWDVYVDSAYFILVTMSSVGYGDMLPITNDERTTAIMLIISGTFIWAYIIGSFSAMLTVMGEDTAKFEGKMRAITELLKFLGVDETMMDSINHYYEYKFANKCMFDEQSIYNELPAKLRADLLLHRYKEIVEKVPFFRNCRDDAIVEIVSQFHSFSVLPGEFVIERGDPHRELVVLTKGMCHSVPDTEDSGLVSKRMESTPGVEIVIEYPSGSFFGELEFLGFGSERLVSVRTKTFCEVSSLHPDDMEEVLRVHVKLRRRLERYGQLKQELATALSKNEGGEMTAEDEFAVELVKQKIEDGWLDENVELRRVFESVDSDGSGALDREEIRGLSVSMGKPITDRELELVMRTMDTDGGGTVSFEEFAAWWDENDGSFKMATKSTVAMETQMRQMKELHEESLDGAMAKMKAELDTMNSRMIRTEDAVARIEANLDRVVQAVCK